MGSDPGSDPAMPTKPSEVVRYWRHRAERAEKDLAEAARSVVPAGGLVAELEAERDQAINAMAQARRKLQEAESAQSVESVLRLEAEQDRDKAKEERDLAWSAYEIAREGGGPSLHDEVCRRKRAEARAEQAENLLKRLSEWDHMQTASDGPYWLSEIAKALDGAAERSAVPTATVSEEEGNDGSAS